MCRLFPCIPILGGFFLLETGAWVIIKKTHCYLIFMCFLCFFMVQKDICKNVHRVAAKHTTSRPLFKARGKQQ